jgi:hypothetical protein
MRIVHATTSQPMAAHLAQRRRQAGPLGDRLGHLHASLLGCLCTQSTIKGSLRTAASISASLYTASPSLLPCPPHLLHDVAHSLVQADPVRLVVRLRVARGAGAGVEHVECDGTLRGGDGTHRIASRWCANTS